MNEKEIKINFLKELINEAEENYNRWVINIDEEDSIVNYHLEFYNELKIYLELKLNDLENE